MKTLIAAALFALAAPAFAQNWNVPSSFPQYPPPQYQPPQWQQPPPVQYYQPQPLPQVCYSQRVFNTNQRTCF